MSVSRGAITSEDWNRRSDGHPSTQSLDQIIRENAALIRVAWIVYFFETGGIERSVAHLANHLDRRRFEPLIVCLARSGSAADWIEKDDVPILEINKCSKSDPLAVLRLAKVLRERRVDIVHSHNWGTLVETTLARRLAGVPAHVHAERGTVMGGLNVTGPKRWLRSRAMRWSLNRVDRVISNARATADRVERLCGYPAARISVIPNGVVCPRVDDRLVTRSEIRRQLKIPAEAMVIGSVGRLVSVKNFGMAIDCVADLLSQQSDVHLILIGDGPERSHLQSQAKALGVDEYVHFVGHRDDIGRWLAALDLYVNCSNSEGLSQSITEAMAIGLPLVVTDVGDSALLTGDTRPCGVLVPKGDTASFRDAVLTLCECSELRNEYGRVARERHQSDYSFSRMIDTYDALYRQLRICRPLDATS